MLRKFRKSRASDVRSGLCIDDARIAIAVVQQVDGDKPALSACAFRASGHDSDWRQRAETRIKGGDLRHSPVSAVMAAGTYNMLLVETPNVPAEEITSAVRWRIKDLIEYPIDDTVIEMLDMPEQANPGHKPMNYAVVTQKATVQEQVDTVVNSSLSMDVIDIPELCIRNIAVSLPNYNSGLAFLHFTENQGFLTITRDGLLYLVRRIEIGRSSLDSTTADAEAIREAVSKIALELQRSLDYYESHYDCPPIRQLLLGPGAGLNNLPEALNAELGLAVGTLDLAELFDIQTPISVEEQGNCLLAIGAALRSNQAAA